MLLASVDIALKDIMSGFKRSSLVGMLGWQDVRQRYRRSSLGPFWLTISMGVMIATIGVVFGEIFKTPLQEFLPFLAIGMILWSLMASLVNEGCTAFIVAEGIVKQLPLPLFVHVMRMVWRNILIFLHNIVIFPFVLLAVWKPVSLVAVLSVPGFLLFILNLSWVALLLSVLCARYRDLPQMIASLLQVAFYMTPIMWMPSLLTGRVSGYLLNFNPLYHLMTVVRSPLIGEIPSTLNWLVSIGMAVVGWIFTLATYGYYKRRIAYWL